MRNEDENLVCYKDSLVFEAYRENNEKARKGMEVEFDKNTYLTRKQVARELGVNPPVLAMLAHLSPNKLPFKKVGKLCYYHPYDVKKFIDERNNSSRPIIPLSETTQLKKRIKEQEAVIVSVMIKLIPLLGKSGIKTLNDFISSKYNQG